MRPCAHAPMSLSPYAPALPLRPCVHAPYAHAPKRPNCQITKPQVPNSANYRLQTQAITPSLSLPMLFTRERAPAYAIPAALTLRAPFLQPKSRFPATISVRVRWPGHYFRRSSLRRPSTSQGGISMQNGSSRTGVLANVCKRRHRGVPGGGSTAALDGNTCQKPRFEVQVWQ